MTMDARAVFLDRDGTVIAEREYLADPEDVELVEGAVEGMRRLQEAGLTLVIVTNQSGIDRGTYTEEDYRRVARRLERVLRQEGVRVAGTYYCPHHPDFSGPCRCRKPDTGMHEEAARELGVRLEGSYYVGDRVKDVRPALTLGGSGILVRTGYGEEEEERLPDGIRVVRDLGEAAEWILDDVAAPGREQEPRDGAKTP